MISSDFSGFIKLSDDVQHILKGFSPKQQEKAKIAIGNYARSSFRKRITQQKNVDGSNFKARKLLNNNAFGSLRKSQQHGKLRKKMLTGFRDKARVAIKIQGDVIEVGYFGWSGNLARDHNEGIGEQVKHPFSGKSFVINRPERNWVGLSKEDDRGIQDILQGILVNK